MGALQIRMCDRENVRGLRTQVCGVAREKKMERKSGADEGCHRIYERKRGTRSMTTAGGHMEVREMPERKNQRVGRGGKMRKRDRGTVGETVEKRTYAQLAEGERREDEGVEQDSAVISKREEACGCDVERPC